MLPVPSLLGPGPWAGRALVPGELSRCVSCLNARFRVSSVGWLPAPRKSPWLLTWGLQRLMCRLEQVVQQCPRGSRMWGQASPSLFPASWHWPSLSQSAGPFSICTQETGGVWTDRRGIAPARMSPDCSALSSEGSGPRGLLAFHLVWLRGPQAPSCPSGTVPPRRRFSVLPSLHLTPSWARITWITLSPQPRQANPREAP